LVRRCIILVSKKLSDEVQAGLLADWFGSRTIMEEIFTLYNFENFGDVRQTNLKAFIREQ